MLKQIFDLFFMQGNRQQITDDSGYDIGSIVDAGRTLEARDRGDQLLAVYYKDSDETCDRFGHRIMRGNVLLSFFYCNGIPLKQR
jgi:hypothetical protein